MDNDSPKRAITVPIYVESRYKVNRRSIKKIVEETIEKNGIVGNVEVSIAVVGDRKMRAMNKKYRGMDKTTNVLSFSQVEGERTPLPDGELFLGDVIVSYPVVITEAARENMLIDDKINELVEHGVLHLLGFHHR